MRSRQAAIASAYFEGSATCEPTWKDSPRTVIPRSAAISSSAGTAAGSQPNFRDRSTTAAGLRNETRSSSSVRARCRVNLRSSSGLSTTKRRIP